MMKPSKYILERLKFYIPDLVRRKNDSKGDYVNWSVL